MLLPLLLPSTVSAAKPAVPLPDFAAKMNITSADAAANYVDEVMRWATKLEDPATKVQKRPLRYVRCTDPPFDTYLVELLENISTYLKIEATLGSC